MDSQEKIKAIEKQIEAALQEIKSSKSLLELKMRFLGKTGEISALMKNMRDVPPEQRPNMGNILNALRKWTEDKFENLE